MPPHALELAKQGDPDAIAALINRHLQTKGITAHVTRQDHVLEVLLESIIPPNAEAMVAYVKQGIINLEADPIHHLRIKGKAEAANEISWEEEVVLKTPDLNFDLPESDPPELDFSDLDIGEGPDLEPDPADFDFDALLDSSNSSPPDLSLDLDLDSPDDFQMDAMAIDQNQEYQDDKLDFADLEADQSDPDPIGSDLDQLLAESGTNADLPLEFIDDLDAAASTTRELDSLLDDNNLEQNDLDLDLDLADSSEGQSPDQSDLAATRDVDWDLSDLGLDDEETTTSGGDLDDMDALFSDAANPSTTPELTADNDLDALWGAEDLPPPTPPASTDDLSNPLEGLSLNGDEADHLDLDDVDADLTFLASDHSSEDIIDATADVPLDLPSSVTSDPDLLGVTAAPDLDLDFSLDVSPWDEDLEVSPGPDSALTSAQDDDPYSDFPDLEALAEEAASPIDQQPETPAATPEPPSDPLADFPDLEDLDDTSIDTSPTADWVIEDIPSAEIEVDFPDFEDLDDAASNLDADLALADQLNLESDLEDELDFSDLTTSEQADPATSLEPDLDLSAAIDLDNISEVELDEELSDLAALETPDGEPEGSPNQPWSVTAEADLQPDFSDFGELDIDAGDDLPDLDGFDITEPTLESAPEVEPITFETDFETDEDDEFPTLSDELEIETNSSLEEFTPTDASPVDESAEATFTPFEDGSSSPESRTVLEVDTDIPFADAGFTDADLVESDPVEADGINPFLAAGEIEAETTNRSILDQGSALDDGLDTFPDADLDLLESDLATDTADMTLEIEDFTDSGNVFLESGNPLDASNQMSPTDYQPGADFDQTQAMLEDMAPEFDFNESEPANPFTEEEVESGHNFSLEEADSPLNLASADAANPFIEDDFEDDFSLQPQTPSPEFGIGATGYDAIDSPLTEDKAVDDLDDFGFGDADIDQSDDFFTAASSPNSDSPSALSNLNANGQGGTGAGLKPLTNDRTASRGRSLWLGLGLGAVVLGIAGVLLNQIFGHRQPPAPPTETVEVPAPNPTPAATPTAMASPETTDPFREAVNAAQSAANLAQTASNPQQWQTVAAGWSQAIDLMQQVPESNPNYATAQQKAKDYQPNLAYAQQQAGNAAAPAADPFREAVNAAQSAANLAQTASTPQQWQTVAAGWSQAIDLMQQVPKSSPNYATAQQKARDYQPNLAYAQRNAK